MRCVDEAIKQKEISNCEIQKGIDHLRDFKCNLEKEIDCIANKIKVKLCEEKEY